MLPIMLEKTITPYLHPRILGIPPHRHRQKQLQQLHRLPAAQIRKGIIKIYFEIYPEGRWPCPADTLLKYMTTRF